VFYNSRNGNVKIGNTDMDYISFGYGQKNLIMIPGLGDGLRSVKGAAASMAMMYRQYTKHYKVYVFSRKNLLEQGYSTRDMAKDQAAAMNELGLSGTYVLGVSQGGMIAQYLAIDYPELVIKLVLAVTLARQNDTILNAVRGWLKMAENNDYKSIFIDTAEKSYTEKRLKKYRPFYPVLSGIGKPKGFGRFIIQANSVIHHDSYNELSKIKCPVLIIGADKDLIVGTNGSEEIAEKLKDRKIIIYKGFGHGVYEENKDFNIQVLNFLEAQF